MIFSLLYLTCTLLLNLAVIILAIFFIILTASVLIFIWTTFFLFNNSQDALLFIFIHPLVFLPTQTA